jgi:hypothetical protein
MGEWTWLFTKFPIADIELMSDPIDAKTANVLVRTYRSIPPTDGTPMFEVRVAPHNVAPFRGGPWLRQFTVGELESPGEALSAFRDFIAEEIGSLR